MRVLQVLALGLGCAVAAAESPLQLQSARILVTSGYFDFDNLPVLHDLQAAGATVRHGQLQGLSWESLSQYNLLLIVDLPPVASDGAEVALVRRFVDSGGSLLVMANFYPEHTHAAASALLAPFGGKILREVVLDPENTFTSDGPFRQRYALTTQIESTHPVIVNVARVWYNTAESLMLHTSPLVVDEGWVKLVHAERSAASYRIMGELEHQRLEPGSFASEPLLVAARIAGQGRILVYGSSPTELFYGSGLDAYGTALRENGDGVRHSDTGTLWANGLNWLAEGARAATALAQAEQPPLQNSWAEAQLPDWDTFDFGGDLCQTPQRGIVGLHSDLSDGGATVEAYVARARQLGLGWVAFCERFEAMTAAKWTELRRRCRAASDAQFVALPGLDYATPVGDRWVMLGDFDWPADAVLKDGCIHDPQFWFTSGVVPNGPYNQSHNTLRPWDHSLYNVWPLQTTIRGQLTSESVAPYRYLQAIQDDPIPLAVDMIYDAEALTAAVDRACTFVLQEHLGDLTELFRKRTYYGSATTFVSDGPLILDWRAHNAVRITGGKWFLPGSECYRVRLSARAAESISDVRIYDGEQLLRHYRPNQQQVTLVFDLPHDMQRNLLAEVETVSGKHAYSGGLFIRDFLGFRFMCSDRCNSICDAVITDERGPYLTGPTAPYQRKVTAFGVFGGRGRRHFVDLPPDFDGGMQPVGMQVLPQLSGLDLWPGDASAESRNQVPVCSRDGILQGDEIVGYFPGFADAWHAKPAPVPIDRAAISYRYLQVTPRAGDAGVLLVEGKIRFAAAGRVDRVNVFSARHSTRTGAAELYTLMTPTKRLSGRVSATRTTATAAMTAGSYVAAYPSLWGSAGAIALDDGCVGQVYAHAPGIYLGVDLAGFPRTVAAGEELSYRLLLVTGPPGEAPTTAYWERFIETMGLRGEPAYTVTEIRHGSVSDRRYTLVLAPDAQHGFSGTIGAADLPVRLPIRVAGMNANWTFAWFDLDRGQWLPSAYDRQLGVGYFSLDTRHGAHRIFAGHPVSADDPDLRLTVSRKVGGKLLVEAHNAGDQAVAATVRLHSALGQASESVELAPGQSAALTLALAPK